MGQVPSGRVARGERREAPIQCAQEDLAQGVRGGQGGEGAVRTWGHERVFQNVSWAFPFILGPKTGVAFFSFVFLTLSQARTSSVRTAEMQRISRKLF